MSDETAYIGPGDYPETATGDELDKYLNEFHEKLIAYCGAVGEALIKEHKKKLHQTLLDMGWTPPKESQVPSEKRGQMISGRDY